MNNVIILDDENKSYTRLFFDYLNNKINIKGYKINDNVISNIDVLDVVDLKELFFPSNCQYKFDKRGYSIFKDSNEYYHFVKDKREDYMMFLEKNDLGAYLYSEGDNEKPKTYRLKQRHKTFIIKVVDVAAMVSLLAFVGTQINIKQNTIFDESFNKEAISISDYVPDTIKSDDDSINAGYLMDLLEKSNIDEYQKEYLLNEELFEDIVLYYKGTIMEVLIKERLRDLRIEYFASDDNSENIELGYYDPSMGNVIHLNSNYSYEFCLGHEFIHLLESPNCTSRFFAETMADIVSAEYLNEPYESYPEQDYLLKLLINIVGPLPVWEYTFKGDFRKIDEILKTNLDEDDYDNIIKIFETNDFNEDNNNELESLIFKIYSNMKNKDIKKDFNIFDRDGDLRDKTAYFNYRKIPDKEYSKYYKEDYSSIIEMFPKQKIGHITKGLNR